MDKKKKLKRKSGKEVGSSPTTRTEWEELLEKENVADKGRSFGILVFVGTITKGANKEKVWKWLNETERAKFDKCWLNLEKNGFFENGKVVVSEDFGGGDSTVELTLAGLCAEGLLERTTKKGGLRRNEEKRS